MRMPVRSERDAFRLTVAGVVVVGAAVLIGWVTEPVVGVAVLVLILVLAGIAYLRAANPDRRVPLREAAAEAHAHGAPPGTRHVLVIANEVLSGEALHELILEGTTSTSRSTSSLRCSPRTCTTESPTSTASVAQARARLERSLAWAREQGIPARGEVGDPSASTAIEDELRDFGADEVIVVTHPRERETWQEHGELERLRRELDCRSPTSWPVTPAPSPPSMQPWGPRAVHLRDARPPRVAFPRLDGASLGPQKLASALAHGLCARMPAIAAGLAAAIPVMQLDDQGRAARDGCRRETTGSSPRAAGTCSPRTRRSSASTPRPAW